MALEGVVVHVVVCTFRFVRFGKQSSSYLLFFIIAKRPFNLPRRAVVFLGRGPRFECHTYCRSANPIRRPQGALALKCQSQCACGRFYRCLHW